MAFAGFIPVILIILSACIFAAGYFSSKDFTDSLLNRIAETVNNDVKGLFLSVTKLLHEGGTETSEFKA